MSGLVSYRTAGRVPAYLILVVLGAVFVVVGAVLVLRGLQDVVHREPKVYEYNGTTWAGDSCFVDKGGQLWCQGGSI